TWRRWSAGRSPRSYFAASLANRTPVSFATWLACAAIASVSSVMKVCCTQLARPASIPTFSVVAFAVSRNVFASAGVGDDEDAAWVHDGPHADSTNTKMAGPRTCERFMTSSREKLLESQEDFGDRRRGQSSEAPDQTVAVDRAYLIHGDETGAVLKSAGNPPRIRLAARRHRSDDHGTKIGVQLVGRHDKARSRLADLAANRRVRRNKVYVAARNASRAHHRHSSMSKRVDVGWSMSRSSPRARMALAAAAQPNRGPRAA